MIESGLIVDLFAGAGGASLGMEMALGRAVDVAVNHNPEAVAIHAANHPTTRHFVQNITEVLPRTATLSQPVDVLWASPDCKHFSKAKGGAPRERHIRELGWAVIRWLRDAKPKLLCVENVEEFQTWGPLGADGQPIKELAGETFREWIEAIKAQGYSVDWRCLRACDYGAPTIRRRLFIVARRDRKAIIWPEPTHGPGRPRPWRTAAECIDWDIPAPSIFGRAKPLAENTLRRIAEGLRRYVIEAREPFIVPGSGPSASWLLQANTGLIGRPTDRPLSTVCQSDSHQQLARAFLSPLALEIGGNDWLSRPQLMNRPFKTLLTREHKALAVASLAPFIQHVQHGGMGPAGVMPADEPLRTITAYPKGGSMALVAPYLVKPGHTADYYNCFRGQAAGEPLQTITQYSRGFALVAASLVTAIQGHAPTWPGRPLPTLTTGNHHYLVAAYLSHFYKTFTGGSPLQPAATVLAQNPHAGLASVFLTKFHGTSTADSLAAPAATLCSQDKLGLTCAFLAKYYGKSLVQGVTVPMDTVTIKDRFGLALVQLAPLVYVEGEAYVIADIGLRMLSPRELARAQGFPDGYILDPEFNGRPLSHKAQVAGIGNSVPPVFSEALVRANLEALAYRPPVRGRSLPLFEAAGRTQDSEAA